MVDENIVKYIKEGKRRGFSASLLKQKLAQGGFDKREVDKAMMMMSGKSNLPKQRIIKPKEFPGSEHSGSRWMKVAGICGMILFSLGLLAFIISFFAQIFPVGLQELSLGGGPDIDSDRLGPTLLIISGIIMLVLITLATIYWTGFIKMGKHVKSKLLKVSALLNIIFMFLVIIGSISLILYVVNLITGSSEGDISGLLGAIQTMLLILRVVLLLMLGGGISVLLFSIAMLRVKDIKFSKLAGGFYVFVAVYGLMLAAWFNLQLFSPGLVLNATGFLLNFGLFIAHPAVGIVTNIIGLAAIFFGSLSLFDASGKYE